MPERSDPMSLSHEAMNSVFTRLVETQRRLDRDLATRPAVPLTSDPDKVVATAPQSQRERQMEYLRIRDDPAAMGAYIAQHSVDLPPDKPYPRAVVDALTEMEAEMEREKD